MHLKIESKADIARFAALGTGLSVIAHGAVASIALYPLRHSLPGVHGAALFAATLIPLLITPPILILLLHTLMTMGKTIERINGHVKYDSLTGILNRGHFLDSVRATRRDGMILIVDVDHFKTVNDDLGHDAGDDALRALAVRISNAVDGDDIVGRLGGEEFAVFLPGQSPIQGAEKAAHICDQVRSHMVPVNDVRLRLTVSIGGAFHAESAPLGHALKLADQRLYVAKHNGRDRHVIEAPATVAVLQTQLKAALR